MTKQRINEIARAIYDGLDSLEDSDIVRRS